MTYAILWEKLCRKKIKKRDDTSVNIAGCIKVVWWYMLKNHEIWTNHTVADMLNLKKSG